MGDSQVDLFGPYPATPEVRQAAILSAFGGGSEARAGSMQAKRGRCPICQYGIGEQCRTAVGRRKKWPHPARLALSVPCPRHEVKAWEPCPHMTDQVCDAREDDVAKVVALWTV